VDRQVTASLDIVDPSSVERFAECNESTLWRVLRVAVLGWTAQSFGGRTMGLFSNAKFDTLDDLLVEQLQDLYDAEKQLTEALPDMVSAARNGELKAAFESHLRETQGHITRLQRVFGILGKNPDSTTCQAMKGLLKEGEEMAEAEGDLDVRDAALIAAAQRVEHYEIAGYGTARTFADRLGYPEAAGILQKTLDEESATDKKLTHIAENSINWKAASKMRTV
jgi:ferritin-like metal-binding protein YciE